MAELILVGRAHDFFFFFDDDDDDDDFVIFSVRSLRQ